MKKYISRKKSCYIEIPHDQEVYIFELREKIDNLMKMGYSHFYFSNLNLNKHILNYLLQLKSIYQSVQVFVVYNSKHLIWKTANVINLPIKIEESENEDEFLTGWLKANCELTVQDL